MIQAGEIQPKSPFYVPETSSGQYPLSNAARSWTKLWLIIRSLGWTPGAICPSSLPVRVSFHSGKGSFITGLISNPRFFELVMGWPIGWTAPGEPVTGFAAWLQRSRTALSQLTLPATSGGPEGAHET